MDYELMMNGKINIGQKAPNFKAVTTYGNKTLKDYEGKWLVFFSHSRFIYPRMILMLEINKIIEILRKLVSLFAYK